MLKRDFTSLLQKVAGDQVSHNHLTCNQAPVSWHLSVVMENFGLSGNGGQCPIIAKLFSVAEGSVDNYPNHCLWVLMNLQSRYVQWPTAVRRQQIKLAIGEESFFKDCVGFIDEMLLPLAYPPQKILEDYY
ncbi:hypothetical protein CROQUDRAFT_19778, partial [Cronartium quercuum f. sp. fusiforme G11]